MRMAVQSVIYEVDMTTNPLVELLASYGPHPNANNLFDEFVSETADALGCKPLHIEQPIIQELEKNFASSAPLSVILSGTAGDGKTYIARNLAQKVSGESMVWDHTAQVASIQQNGREIKFIKDLSQLGTSELESFRKPIVDALLGNSDDLYVICVNDGFLLKFFRDDTNGGRELYDRLVEIIQSGEVATKYKGFMFHNLSVGSQLNVFDKILDAIVDHEDWSKCECCPRVIAKDSPCPIRCNLEILRSKDPNSMRARLKDLIQMSAADKNHLSIRHLILLIVNTLLGDSTSRQVLLNCETAKQCADSGDYQKTNPYANVFGENINDNNRKQYLVFDVLRKFGIGKETNNYFDNELLLEEKLFPNRDIYELEIFGSIRKDYLNNPQKYADAYNSAVVQQRRRVFFTSQPSSQPDHISNGSNPWSLSEFKYGVQYLNLVKSLSDDSKVNADSVKVRILTGLNRMMTGLMADSEERLWLIEPVGVFHGSETPMVIESTGPKSAHDTTTFLTFVLQDEESKLPLLSVFPNRREDCRVSLTLNPTLVECLLRVADGALPSSFSNECIQEIRRFQLRVVSKIRIAFDNRTLYKSEVKLDAGKLRKVEIEYLKSKSGGI